MRISQWPVLTLILFGFAARAESEGERCLVDETALQDLVRQKASLKEQQAVLNKKEEDLKQREIAIQEEIKKIEELRKQVKAASELFEAKNEERISKMVETLEKMSPKAAAVILAQTEDALSVPAATRLSAPILAKVLSAMDPQVSSRLAELMALGKTKQTKKGVEKNNGSNG